VQLNLPMDNFIFELLQEANPTILLSDWLRDLSQPLKCSVVGSRRESPTFQLMLEVLHEVDHG